MVPVAHANRTPPCEVESMSQLKLIYRGIWKHSIVCFTKVRDKVCQALRALTCCTTDDVHHGSSQASVGSMSCTRGATSNCKYCILNVQIYIYLKEMSFSNMKNCNSV
jgi:hypothetical protein